MLIKYSEIPQWLQESLFFNNLSSEDLDGSIDIPNDCFRSTCDSVRSTQDLAAVLNVVRFWGTIQIPQSVLEFCYVNHSSEWIPAFADTFGSGMSEHDAVYQCFKDPSQFSLAAALSTNRPEFVTFWLSKNLVSCKENKNSITQACRHGRLDLVQTLREREFLWDDNSHCAAAQYGHLHVLHYLHEHDCPSIRIALKYADWSVLPPVGGYLECLRYALENHCPIDTRACDRACTYGLLDCLQLLHQHNAPWDASTTKAVAGAGHLDCLMYLIENNCPCNFLATEQAAANGHLECVQYLHEHVPRVCEGMIAAAAASGGNLQCLQFLHKHKYGWNAHATARAAQGGHFECLLYLHVNGCVWNEEASKYAALYGHIACLVYLFENGCAWNRDAPSGAALNNHLHCLEFLYNHGCPWDESAATNAAQNGHIDCLRFLAEKGCPCCSVYTLKAAAGASSVDCLKYLIEERGAVVPMDGVVFGEALAKARSANMHYLIENGYHVKSFAFL